MPRHLRKALSGGYVNGQQKTRVMTEPWVENHFSCPLCAGHLKSLPANTKSIDFFCIDCDDTFQLKARKKRTPTLPKCLKGSEYAATIKTIKSKRKATPHLLVLIYHPDDLRILGIYFFNKSDITVDIISPLKPLPAGTKREGRQGCVWNIYQIKFKKFFDFT